MTEGMNHDPQEERRYFNMNIGDAVRAMGLMNEEQKQEGVQPSMFRIEAVSSDASIWPTFLKDNFRFENILRRLEIEYNAGPEQQVKAPLDEAWERWVEDK